MVGMLNGIKNKLSSLVNAMTEAAKGTESYASQAYTSELSTTCYTDLRTSWIEATRARQSHGPDSYYVFKMNKSEVIINAPSPVTMTTYNKEFMRNLDGTIAVYTKTAAIEIMQSFEAEMERRCLKEKTPDTVNYSKALREDDQSAHASAPAISLF